MVAATVSSRWIKPHVWNENRIPCS